MALTTLALLLIVQTEKPKFDPLAVEVTAMVNELRKENNVGPVKLHDKIVKAAELHTMDMAKTGDLSHTGSDKSDMQKRVDRTGYYWYGLAENIACGQKTAAEVFKAWKDSPDHKANMIARYKDIGVASAIGADGKRYWTMVLAR